MGPFPHDAPPAEISADNPMGTDGFEFVEYAHPKPEELHALFKLMGYVAVARHRTKKITVYRQGDINYLVNEEPGTHGFEFVAAHGPSFGVERWEEQSGFSPSTIAAEIAALIRQALDSEDYREGARAFLEKRAAKFTGR